MGRALGTLFTRALVVVLVFLVAGAVAEDDTGNVAATVAMVGAAAVALLFVIEVAQPTGHGLTIETTGPPYALIAVRHAEPLVARIAQYGDRHSIHKR